MDCAFPGAGTFAMSLILHTVDHNSAAVVLIVRITDDHLVKSARIQLAGAWALWKVIACALCCKQSSGRMVDKSAVVDEKVAFFG